MTSSIRDTQRRQNSSSRHKVQNGFAKCGSIFFIHIFVTEVQIEVMKKIIGECEKRKESIYLLGASEENLKTCVANIVRDYPDIKIAGYHNGFFDLNNPGIILEEIKEKKPTALFVAMGCPRQETFIIKYMNDLPCKIFMGVGGSFDVIAEKVNRAPKWMINIGMEWAYRVAKEPWRIKRLGSIPKFIWTVAKSRGNK